MPVRIIGMIGVTPPSSDATLHVIEGGLSPNYVAEFARAHDEAGFDLALVGYSSSSAEGFLVALHAAAHTKRLGYLVAHRPGFVAPTLMARKIATFDHLSGGTARRAHHHRQDRRRAAGRRRLQPEGRALSARRGVSRIDAACLVERAAVRFLRRVLSRQRRAFRCAPAAEAASAAFLRRRLATARSQWARGSATSTPSMPSRSHRRASASRSSAARRRHSGAWPAFNISRSPHHRRQRRRGMGQGKPHPRGDDRQEGLEPAGSSDGPVDNAGKRLMSFALGSRCA